MRVSIQNLDQLTPLTGVLWGKMGRINTLDNAVLISPQNGFIIEIRLLDIHEWARAASNRGAIRRMLKKVDPGANTDRLQATLEKMIRDGVLVKV